MLVIETSRSKISDFLNSNMCFCSRLYGTFQPITNTAQESTLQKCTGVLPIFFPVDLLLHSSKSTGKETGKTHLCAVSWKAERKPDGLDLIQPWSERKPVYQPFHLPCFLKFFHLLLSMMNIWPFKQLADLCIKSYQICQGKKWMNFLIWSDPLLNSSLILSWPGPTIFLKLWPWNLLMFYSKLEDKLMQVFYKKFWRSMLCINIELVILHKIKLR